MSKYITAGELAKLACTTKRTIHFYNEKGILKPVRINSKKYRYYEEKQVLDYQMILLLRTLGVSLNEIKRISRQKGGLQNLFNNKKVEVENKINELQFNLQNLNKFTNNLSQNKTMVDPKIITLPTFDIFYIERIGSYSQIGSYCKELFDMFEKTGKIFTTLAIFDDPTYQPKKSKIKVAVLAKKGMEIKNKFILDVKSMKFAPGKVITYTYNGSGSLLSFFWKELEKYCAINNIKVRKNVPDFEIYRKVNKDVTKQYFEIYLPIY